MELNALLITTGTVVLFAIIVYRFRKLLNLTITRMVYGEYSLEFFRLFKKYYIRSPFQYCFRDEFITHLLFVLEKQDGIPKYKSPKEIFFEKTPYFIPYKDFLKQKGEPYCFNAFSFRNPDFVIKAVGYHDKIAGSKAVIVFYFMNDLFFMGEYIFRNPKTRVRESLVGHFLEGIEVENDNFYIENTRKRVVHYQDTGFTVDIKYLTEENDQVTENLRAYLHQIKNKKLETVVT
jgi:hypothetical protein